MMNITSKQRADFHRQQDTYKSKVLDMRSAVYFKAMSLEGARGDASQLLDLVRSVNRLSRFMQCNSDRQGNLKLMIWISRKLHREYKKSAYSNRYLSICKKHLLCARSKTHNVCQEFGNVCPFLRPIGKRH